MTRIIFFFASLMCGVASAQTVSEIYNVDERVPHDQVVESLGSHLYLREGEVVALEGGIGSIDSVEVVMPPRAEVTRAYYGYAPDEGRVLVELSARDITLVYEIVSRFSFRQRMNDVLYRVEADGSLKSEDARVSRIANHLCTLGIYLFAGDRQVMLIDGHPDMELFIAKGPKLCGFRNPTLNVFLEAKMEEKKNGGEPGATDNPDGAQRFREDH